MSEKKPAKEPERQPDLEIRTFPFAVEDVRDAEGGRSKDFTIKGHAAVYNKWSHDLGGFREKIAKGAFDNALSRDPHVLHLWDHDTRFVLSSTRNKTLELRSDPAGLRMWSKVAPTSYAADLRVLMERDDINQSSFAFTVAKDEWKIVEEGDEERVERTILEVGELFDVTTTAMGAYPTTDSQVAMRTREHARALAEGLPESTPAETLADAAPETVAADGTEPPLDNEAGSEAITAERLAAVRDGADLFALKRAARNRIAEGKAAKEQLERELSCK